MTTFSYTNERSTRRHTHTHSHREISPEDVDAVRNKLVNKFILSIIIDNCDNRYRATGIFVSVIVHQLTLT